MSEYERLMILRMALIALLATLALILGCAVVLAVAT